MEQVSSKPVDLMENRGNRLLIFYFLCAVTLTTLSLVYMLCCHYKIISQ